MDSKDKVLMSAMEYFLSRKNVIDRYVEGEHKWYGDVDQSAEFNPRPWYLEPVPVSKTPVGGWAHTRGYIPKYGNLYICVDKFVFL